ncbi:hypothetical protein SAMN02745121_09038 [Nannocystis exedens]|uniref:Hemerythrin-like domain-containing protein n=1 Tax=Nannocystis exedens TaxID=54 RepID=A0A1I2IVN7_9BACT|nr:hemerythrin domain-containing protein [Nannocystis exedens]PCC67174.1 hypothetical protein NAEX_00177 [Nannocystis exedens]SFF46552.1 hypothetical protein SAMN02745121_09038 [Nannocystis exedens]
MASIFQHLREEHERLQRSIVRLRGVEPGADRVQPFNQLRRQYVAYARAAAGVLYSYLIHVKTTQQRALQGLEEHKRLEEHLLEAERVLTDDRHWRPTIASLCEELVRHLRDEERGLFSTARVALSDREATGLGACFAAERARLHGDLSNLTGNPPEPPAVGTRRMSIP